MGTVPGSHRSKSNASTSTEGVVRGLRKGRGQIVLFKKNKGGWAGAKYMPARQVIRTVATKRSASSKHARAPPSPHPKGGREGGSKY